MIINRVKSILYSKMLDCALGIIPYLSDSQIEKVAASIPNEDARHFFQNKIKPATMIRLIRRFRKELNPRCRKQLIKCFFINEYLIGKRLRNDYEKRTGIPVPVNLLISVNTGCNLSCKYCYGPKRDKNVELPLKVIDKVVLEAKNLGTYWNVISGGEPFFRKDLLDVFKKHNNVAFTVFTNGYCINEELAKKLESLGNVMPAISLEGFQVNTDARRGKGAYKKAITAMSILRKHGIAFAYSITMTKRNVDEVSGKKFIKEMIRQGAMLGFYLPYIPTGQCVDIRSLVPPKKKIDAAKKLAHLRKNLPIFIDDFQHRDMRKPGCKGTWGRHLHINVDGFVTPCISTDFATDNIKEKTLEDALRSNFLKSVRSIPSIEDGSKPCLILHNPYRLRAIVKRAGAKPTSPKAEHLYTKYGKIIIRYSKKYEKMLIDENKIRD